MTISSDNSLLSRGAVMACTQQSAVEYIKNARVILVEQLKNQPLIVEKLREKEVLNLHQCTEINEEPKTFEKNRKILDFVTSKGNKACYELLRVLNTTRQRTLPKPTGQQKDLHHWISCFPFTEDQEMEPSLGSKACQEYQKQLRREAQKILQASVRQKKCLGGDAAPEAFCYTPLVLDPDTDHNSVTSKIQTKSKKYKKSRPKKLKSFIPKAQGQLSPEDLLWGEKNLIVLVGKPGIGKSTVTHQMLHLWCERQNGGLDYLFYLDDRLLSTSTPAQLESLFDSYVEPRESREEVYEDITEHSENVTIIFDGLTDVLLHPLLEKIITKSILEDARIVITCRPEQLFDLSERIDPHVVHVQGFSEESIRTYLTEKLSDQPDAVASVVEHLELFSLCHVPLHAFMVAVCISFLSREADRSWNVTEIHLHIFRQIIMKCENVSMRNIDGWIRKHGEQILSLAEIARNATLQKTLDIRDHEASGIQCHFLKSLSVMDTPTSVRNHSAFLNSSMQDFFGALWLLCHPAEIDAFLQKCWTEEGKHLKYTIPFLCGFMSERNIPLLKGLVPKTQIQLASDCFHEKLLRLLFEPEGDQHFEKSEEEELSNIADDEDLLFHCQCLYESQSPEACLQFLERLKWHLDLSGSHLDPHQCCTLAYVISQSKEQKVHLELKKCRISDPGVKMILGCSQHFSSASTLCHVWLHVLSSEDPRDFTGLLAACGNELHLPVGEQPTIFKNAGGILRRSPGKINLCLHWDTTTHHLSKALWTVIFSEFPHIHSIRLNLPLEDQNLRLMSLHQDLCVLGAEFFFQILYGLHSSHKTPAEMGLFLMDLYSSLMKSFLPALQPVYQPASPAVWTIELSERKTSIFLEVLKMQTEKKPVELRGWSDEGSEVRSFLQSLKYISHIGLTLQNFSCSVEQDEIVKMFLLNLCLQSAHYHIETVKTTVETLMVLFREHCKDRSSFLLDLCSHVKNYESQTGRSFLPALQPVYQSASPAVWTIDLSERKASIFLEVLKMQSEKKPVELRGWSDEESEVRSFLQCLNYVSQLRFTLQNKNTSVEQEKRVKMFLLDLCLQAALSQTKSIKTTVETLMVLFHKYCRDRSSFLLDLCSHVKNYESQTGGSFLPALQPVYQSASPAVWTIDLSERKASIFLEVLKMQSEKKPVELRGWSDKESEVRSFLQCLNYVSQLRFTLQNKNTSVEQEKRVKMFLLDLCLQAALSQTKSIKTTVETLMVLFHKYCRDRSSFLLDLCSHVKNYESQTGGSFLPALQPVYQSAAPAVWTIELSEKKASIFLEVLKMQTEKKPVELRGLSDEESEVRSFLQCLNYVSQLRFCVDYNDERRKKAVQFLLNLITASAEWDAATGESFSKILTSVCSYKAFPHGDGFNEKYLRKFQSDFLLDLYSHVKNYESQTGRSFLPALQPVYQSAAPAVWTIYLSERKTSIFLEVLKMQTEKKPVELRGWSDEESEVRSFLQCLNYVSQLRFYVGYDDERRKKAVQVLLNLITAAAEWDADTGESFSKILTSVCSYKTFPRGDDHFGDDDDDVIYHSDFLLDLCSHVKNYESQTGRSFLPALQPVYQSASPAVWTIDLSERKASIFLEVLKMQPEKKPVKLRGWSDEESEVRSFLQCLKYVSQLSGADEFFPAVCKAVGPRQVEQVTPLLQAMGFTLTLGGDLSSHCCRSVGRVLGLSASRLDLTLQPEHISLRGTRLIFKHIHTLHKLRLNKKMLFRITRALRSQGGCSSFTIEELSFIQPEGALSSVMSSMVLLLRHWTVRCLDLTACQIEAQSVTGLLMYQGLLTIRLSAESLQLLTLLVYEAHEEELTQHFLQKVSGDLTSCSLNWEVIHYLLQVKGPPITVDFRRNKMTLQNIRDIFPHGNRVMIKRLPPRFLMVIMREIYETRAAHCVSSLLKWSEKNIVLNSRVQDAADCAALCFTLQHSEGVQLSLLWSSIPEGALENILLLLNNVSLLSVDRKLLLRLLHCCFSSELQQGAAAALLRSLQHRLNFSCDSAVDLTGPTDGQVLVLGHEDCMVVSMVIQRSSVAVELSLHDCEIEDAGLQQFFPILHKICLSCSKALLLHFLSLLSGGSEAESVKCAESLSQALGGEVDLSQTPVDPGVCGSIALLLEYSEGLSELDLSHCQLTDRCLELLLPHLQKTRVLDLSHNNITDCMTERLYSIISASSNLHTVRLFNNKIKDKKLLVTDRRVEIW
ncbi:uncharacterized protein LOC114796725 isoform X6 [Denticeps clupeoides]|uniref:uncharacterized protein LOC114796725 isoform X6 n=1 Tax=Denticeps clupeoides TaxID=299321 RepID=UPI0010A2F9B9|nr:uncharacterized protein LOC114796725 isoform X6 [Denticeps clupeoides]